MKSMLNEKTGQTSLQKQEINLKKKQQIPKIAKMKRINNKNTEIGTYNLDINQ